MAPWVAGVLAVLAIGLPAFVGDAIEDQPLFTIGQAILLTVPMTLSLAFIAYRWWPNSPRGLHPLYACLIFVGAGLLGSGWGLPGSLTPADLTKKNCPEVARANLTCLDDPLVPNPGFFPLNWASYAGSFLLGYLKVYGAPRFISSLVVAGFLAYTADHYSKGTAPATPT